MIKTFLKISIALLLFASIFLNYLLFEKTTKYYKDINKLRIDPIETSVFDKRSGEAKFRKENRSIILFGDSRIANWNPKISLQNCDVINQGIRGQTTAQLKMRLEEDVIRSEPDIVIIQMGINDIKAIGLFDEDVEIIVENCIRNLTDIVTKIASNNAHVIVLTVFPTGKPGILRSWLWSDRANEIIEQVNTTLKTLKNNKIQILDVGSILGEKGYIKAVYEKDMLHINRSGYEKLNELLQPQIKKLLAGKSD